MDQSETFEQKSARLTKTIIKFVTSGVIFILALVVIFGSFTTIKAGNVGVVLKFGNVNRLFTPGLHFKTPFAEKVVKMETRTQKVEVEASASSKDLQTVTTRIALNYNIIAEKAGLLYEEVGTNYRSRIVDPAIQDVVKASTALFNAEELITKRPEVKSAIELMLKERLAEEHLFVSNVAIVNFKFSSQFNLAIEAKVTAEQNALTEKNNLKVEEFKAEQRIAEARGEAEAIAIQARAITQQGGKDYVNLQWIKAWGSGGATVPQTVIGEGGGNFLFQLN